MCLTPEGLLDGGLQHQQTTVAPHSRREHESGALQAYLGLKSLAVFNFGTYHGVAKEIPQLGRSLED